MSIYQDERTQHALRYFKRLPPTMEAAKVIAGLLEIVEEHHELAERVNRVSAKMEDDERKWELTGEFPAVTCIVILTPEEDYFHQFYPRE